MNPDDGVMSIKEGDDGLLANALKFIAIAAMVVAHTGSQFIAYDQVVLSTIHSFINYITAPIIFYFLVEGYHHTRNLNRYLLRMAVFALVSYVPYILCMRGVLPDAGNYLVLNVGFTLFFALGLLRIQDEIKGKWLKYLATAAVFLLGSLGDWGYKGLLMALIFNHFYGEYKNQAFAFAIYALSSTFLNMALQPMDVLKYGQEMNFDSLYGFGIILTSSENSALFSPCGSCASTMAGMEKAAPSPSTGFISFIPCIC